MIQKNLLFIRSDELSDEDFINFLCSLIKVLLDDRPIFEEIYRDKWLNKDYDFVTKIFNGFKIDEQKMILELQKSDYLLEKKKDLDKVIRKKYIFSQKIKKKKELN